MSWLSFMYNSYQNLEHEGRQLKRLLSLLPTPPHPSGTLGPVNARNLEAMRLSHSLEFLLLLQADCVAEQCVLIKFLEPVCVCVAARTQARHGSSCRNIRDRGAQNRNFFLALFHKLRTLQRNQTTLWEQVVQLHPPGVACAQASICNCPGQPLLFPQALRKTANSCLTK